MNAPDLTLYGIAASYLALLVAADYFNRLTVMNARRWFMLIGLGAGMSGGLLFIGRGEQYVVLALAATVVLALLELNDATIDAVEGATRGGAISAGALLLMPLLPTAATSFAPAMLVAGTGLLCGALTSLALAQVKWLRLVWLAVTPLASYGLALLVAILSIEHATSDVVIGTIAGLPVLLLIAVMLRTGAITRELVGERKVGLFDEPDPAALAHPFSRLRFKVWADPQARRKYVQLATILAIKKKRQRGMAQQRARLHQLEILKLRMDLLELLSITRMVERDQEESAERDRESGVSFDSLG